MLPKQDYYAILHGQCSAPQRLPKFAILILNLKRQNAKCCAFAILILTVVPSLNTFQLRCHRDRYDSIEIISLQIPLISHLWYEDDYLFKGKRLTHDCQSRQSILRTVWLESVGKTGQDLLSWCAGRWSNSSCNPSIYVHVLTTPGTDPAARGLTEHLQSILLNPRSQILHNSANGCGVTKGDKFNSRTLHCYIVL